MLWAFEHACKKLGIVSFLISGTCLGFYRDKDYVEDNDIDVAIVCSLHKYHKLWSSLSDLPDWDDPHGLRKAEKMQLDIHYIADKRPYVITDWKIGEYAFWRFGNVFCRGRKYRVPYPIEDYLNWMFTPSWKTPLSRREWLEVRSLL